MNNSYAKLGLSLVLSFFIMYAVMFLNVFSAGDIFLSATRVYMSLLMVTPMVLVMLVCMGSMFKNKKLNLGLAGGSIAVFLIVLFLLRSQTFIADRQYLQAMIPHHSSAVLTSTNANLSDAETRALASSIIESQQREIRQMKAILKRMDNEDK